MSYALDGTNISLAFKLKFFCTNSEVEYEAVIIGLISALKTGVLGSEYRET